MARAKPWAKLWVGWYHKTDWLSLSLAEKGAWWLLYSLAQELERDGRMVSSDGNMTLRDITRALHLEERSDRDIFRRMVKKRLAQGGLHWDGDTLVLTDFATEQARTPSKEKEAVAERVRRYRERQQRSAGTSLHTPPARQSVTDSSLPPAVSEAEVPENGGQSVTGVTALPLSPLSSSSEEVRGSGGKEPRTVAEEEAMVVELSRCYEDNIGLLSATARELFDDFLEEYHGPISWIADAFKEGVKYNHRSWAYISKILMNWQNEGRGERDHGRQGGRDEAPERDPLAGARETGWNVKTYGEHDGSEDEDED